jgi:hypothetical protein
LAPSVGLRRAAASSSSPRASIQRRMWNMSLFNFELRVLLATLFKFPKQPIPALLMCLQYFCYRRSNKLVCRGSVLPPAYHRWRTLVHRQ